MGQALRELEPGDIDRAITLMAGATAIITMAGCIYLAFRIYWH